jgi:hypothetical protein
MFDIFERVQDRLVIFLIASFTMLVTYQFFTQFRRSEGFEGETASPSASTGTGTYKEYNGNDVATLAHQNAGNIQVLKGQMDNLNGVKDQVQKNKKDIETLQTQVNALAQAQTQPVAKVTNPTPAITGT